MPFRSGQGLAEGQRFLGQPDLRPGRDANFGLIRAAGAARGSDAGGFQPAYRTLPPAPGWNSADSIGNSRHLASVSCPRDCRPWAAKRQCLQVADKRPSATRRSPNGGHADGERLVVAAPTPTRPDRSMHDSSLVVARPARSEQSPGVGALAGQRLPGGAYTGVNVSGGLSAHQAAGVGAAGSTTTRLHRNPSTTK